MDTRHIQSREAPHALVTSDSVTEPIKWRSPVEPVETLEPHRLAILARIPRAP